MLKQVLYSSTANAGITMRDVLEVIRVSRNQNGRLGLTGGLLFSDGFFYQLLEGEPGDVDAAMQRIQRDWRHHDVLVRREQQVSSPVFPDGWIALHSAAQIPSSVFREHYYEPGMPAERFTADDLFAFLLACFEHELHQQMV